MKRKFFEWLIVLGFQLIELGCNHISSYLCIKRSRQNGAGWETSIHVIDVSRDENSKNNNLSNE